MCLISGQGTNDLGKTSLKAERIIMRDSISMPTVRTETVRRSKRDLFGLLGWSFHSFEPKSAR